MMNKNVLTDKKYVKIPDKGSYDILYRCDVCGTVVSGIDTHIYRNTRSTNTFLLLCNDCSFCKENGIIHLIRGFLDECSP